MWNKFGYSNDDDDESGYTHRICNEMIAYHFNPYGRSVDATASIAMIANAIATAIAAVDGKWHAIEHVWIKYLYVATTTTITIAID